MAPTILTTLCSSSVECATNLLSSGRLFGPPLLGFPRPPSAPFSERLGSPRGASPIATAPPRRPDSSSYSAGAPPNSSTAAAAAIPPPPHTKQTAATGQLTYCTRRTQTAVTPLHRSSTATSRQPGPGPNAPWCGEPAIVALAVDGILAVSASSQNNVAIFWGMIARGMIFVTSNPRTAAGGAPLSLVSRGLCGCSTSSSGRCRSEQHAHLQRRRCWS